MTAEDSWESVVLELERSKQRFTKLSAHLETIGDHFSEIADWLLHRAMSMSEDGYGNKAWRDLPRDAKDYAALPQINECISQVAELRALSTRIDQLENRKQRLGGVRP